MAPLSGKREAPTPEGVFTHLLGAAAGTELVLVGGQALALWLREFDLLENPLGVAISNDVDFLTDDPGDKVSVAMFAQVLHGRPLYPSWRAMTSLVGSAVLDLSQDEYLNVDVLWNVVGLDPAQVREQAVVLENGVKVMHPLHVLYSRLANLHELNEKQNEKGCNQLRLAIDVVRQYLRQLATEEHGQHRPARLMAAIKAVARWARDDAGRKVAARYGIHVADAIDPMLVPSRSRYWQRGWPWQQQLMSDAYRLKVGKFPE